MDLIIIIHNHQIIHIVQQLVHVYRMLDIYICITFTIYTMALPDVVAKSVRAPSSSVEGWAFEPRPSQNNDLQYLYSGSAIIGKGIDWLVQSQDYVTGWDIG